MRRRGRLVQKKIPSKLKRTLPLVGAIQRKMYSLSLRDSRACALPKLGANQPMKNKMRERRVQTPISPQLKLYKHQTQRKVNLMKKEE